MLVTFTNASGSEIYLSCIYMQLAAGASLTTHRSVSELDSNQALKALVAAGTVTLAFTAETGDNIPAGFGQVPLHYSNATRPAATSVPTFTLIYNTDDAAYNVSDGAAWRDMMGVLT